MKKIKLIRQHDSMLCGVACLQMICNFYGKQYSSETLARLAGITNQGLSMLGIKKTAEYLGLEAVCAKISMEQLCTMPLPCILHWNQNHFVVLYHINKNQIFYIADPGKGMLKFRKDEFKEYWSAENCTTPEGNGIALLLDVTDNFGKVDEDKSVNKNIILHFLCHYLQGYKKYFILILCGLLIGSVLQLLFPFLTQNIVDLGIKNKDINFIWLILLGSLLIVISQAIAEITRRWLLLHISIRINICMISDFLMKLLKLPMRFFDSKKGSPVKPCV